MTYLKQKKLFIVMISKVMQSILKKKEVSQKILR